MLLDELNDILVHILGLRTHLIVEVGTVEGTLELLGIHHPQVLLDIGTHLVGSRSGQGDDRCLPDLVDDRTDSAILRAEVVTPLRDTMGLVDGVERNLHRLEEVHVLLLRERLGCHVEQLGMTRRDVSLHLIDGRLVERRVQVVGRPLVLAQLRDEVHLVLHQGNQRRDDDGRPLHQQRRQLIAQ